jgi:hypothetical protein
MTGGASFIMSHQQDSPFNVVANSSTNNASLRDCALLTGWIAKKVAGSGSKRIEHRHEPTCSDVIGDFPPGLLRDAQSREGPDHRQFRIGCSKRAGHPKLSGAVAAAETPLGAEMKRLV